MKTFQQLCKVPTNVSMKHRACKNNAFQDRFFAVRTSGKRIKHFPPAPENKF
ncbi:hypothetical protein ApDm4_1370 [Acetobacter pomorum]|nr:hypothetical protein ApDm4_1370 [Acetobacter pomorum]